MNDFNQYIRVIPDYPKSGISFRDITSLFEKPEVFTELRTQLVHSLIPSSYDKVVAIEARGFITGSILADRLRAGLVLARKKGKLPPPVCSETYQKEYGVDELQIPYYINRGDSVLIHDDILATGGTALAVYNMVKQFQPSSVEFSFLTSIPECNGLELLQKYGKVHILF